MQVRWGVLEETASAMEGMFAAGGQPGRGEKGILLLMMRCGVCVSLPHEFLIITLENTEKMEVKKTERQGKKHCELKSKILRAFLLSLVSAALTAPVVQACDPRRS
jgi:hypothetical protein